ncbi:MAG: AAA family ATPase [Oceanospirillales bacterium]|nr:AAA family ATPase [Oceanospirillales bacterium]
MQETMRWNYRAFDGTPYGYVSQREERRGSQSPSVKHKLLPHFHGDDVPGIPGTLPGTSRIFGSETLKSRSNPVFVTGTEKCAYALQGLGLQAITSLGRHDQVHLADWALLAKASEIYLLIDDHDNGSKYAQGVYQSLRPLLTETKIYTLECAKIDSSNVCSYLKTFPELAGWNELESLTAHPQRDKIASRLSLGIKGNREPIPPNWKFIITRNNHKLITANDFCNLKLPPRQLLLSPWLAEGSINMIFADRGIGKTFFCLSAAIAIANGEDFVSYTAPVAAPVLYLDGEMQATAMQERFRALGGTNTKAPLYIYTPDVQDQDSGTPDLGEDAGRNDINSLIEQVAPKVVFIDNISTFVRTGNENEADSWAPVQEWLVQLRKRGIAIVLVHHANKEGKQRGSHKKEDVMDVVIQLKRPDDYISGEDATRMLVKYTKARHLEAKNTRDMEATLCNDEGKLIWAYADGDPSYALCTELLKSKALSYAEIAEELSVSKSTVHRWKKKAQGEGII